MKERISSHKRKVSESAQKLASILELDMTESKINPGKSALEDYEKINTKMQSISNQKE